MTLVAKPIPASSTFNPTPTNPFFVTANVATDILLALPARTSSAASVNSVTFTRNDGSGPVTQNKKAGGAVVSGDLGTTITVTNPSVSDSDSKTLTYTLTASNNTTTPFNAVSTAIVTVVPN